ncbi:host specificity factor TipJ family phage tail protein [Comamonas testosteroni]|uniref:Uncharacterized protein n=1 Tax=Comamonas testosteroni (strain DSM 14576 / KF-1) TaxID=399795 RepID=B7X0Z9_COMTK|nr:host specificity factor TipJ family phage tail protein [Comamonas testosteroni]EED68330.1 Protein of unknown function DUF1983 [Comamonas testosteroni KF-1]EED68393.1 Protein of unknown function DUF1983 [Comamonas testosteroni KF-1]WQG66425.1 host specificity factor TipJ family phage tail protein [Comamonas testosteroni]
MEVNRAESAAVAAVGGVAAEVLDAAGRLVVTPETFRLEGQRNVPADLRPGESLSAFLGRHVPGIESGAWNVSISGYDVPQAMWARTFPKHGQLIACRGVPRRSALQLVAIAALTYFSGGIAGGIYGALGGTYVSAAAGMYLSAIQVGVLVAGSVLINKVLGPKVPKAGETAAARQVYSLTGQRNSARLYEPLPVLWGEMRVTPDLASKSYGWYEGDSQYQAVRLLGGINVHSASDLAVGDTALSSYDSVETYFSGFPGHADQAIPLSGNVDSIAGGELPDDPNTPVVRTSSADTVALGVDLEYMVFHQGDKGTESASVQVVVEYAPTGSGNWVRVHDALLTSNDTAPRRISWQFDVPSGQYDVRVQRSPKGGNDKTTRQVTWTSLRSIQPDTTDYGQWGCIGIKIKATGQINGSLDSVRATYRARPMPIWTGTEWATANTRADGLSNPGAILLQTLRGVWGIDKDGQRVLQFGFGLSDEQIDIEGLKAFMLHCAARGYTYDKWITSTMSLGSFCEEVALAGMGEFAWTDGSRPTAVFVANGQPNSAVVNMANMLKGGFSVDYALSNAADGIEYQWLNRDTWEMTTLRVMAPGVTDMLSPARVTGEGITSEAHAAVMARYHLAQSLYQYKTVRFTADIEHLDYRRLSVLSVSHDLTQWGFGGRVMAAQRIGAKVQLTLDDPVPPLATAYVGLRIPGERDYRVFKVEALAAESDVITLADPWPEGVALPGEPKNGKDNPAHDTLWCYDFKATPGYRVRVTGIDPESDLKGARVTAVPEGPEFWDYVLNGNYVPAPNQSSIPQLGRPAVKNLRVFEKVNLQGDTEWYELSCIWDVEGDYDHAQVWAGRDGSELRMVDGNAPGGRSTFRIDGAGEWLIVVRPFNAGGQAGQSATLLYITTMTQLPPRNVDDFVVQEVAGGLRRFAWQYAGDRPPAFAGVQIRYLPGDVMLSVADWDAMQPLGEAGDIYRAQFETTRPQAGLWTFGCRAIDTAGQLANGVLRFVADLGDSFEQVQQPDLTPPPDVTGLKATGMFTAVMLEWDVPAYSAGHGHARTIIYAAPGAGAALADALPVAEAFSGPVSFASAANAAWTVWARNQSVDGVLSANAAGGLTVRTSQDVDDVMSAMEGKISEDQLVQHLGDRIGLVDGSGPGSVNARLGAEAAERNALLAQERTVRANEIAAEQQQRAAADTLEAQTRAAGLLQQSQNLGNAVASLTQQIQDGDGALSQRIDSVVATNYSRPNLVAGLQAWTLSSGFQVLDHGWGEALYTYEDGTAVALSPAIPAIAGAGYVLTYDSLRFSEGGSMYMDLQYFDAAGLFIGESDQVMRYDSHDFREDDQNRLVNAHYAVAPAGTVSIKVRAVTEAGTGVSVIGWRQPKLERGTLPATRYSSEAQAALITAAVRDETAARITAVSAEAQQRSDLAVQLRGNATGSDLGSVTTGLVAQERNARVAADNSLAYQMSMLSAGVGEQFDTSSIWYFDTEGDPEGWAGRGPLTVTGGFMRLPDSTGWANVVSPAGLGVDANTYRQVKMRIRKHGAPVWVGLLMWRSESDAGFDYARSATVAEPAYDANGIALVSWEPAWSGLIDQLNFDVFQEQQPGGWFEMDWVAVGRPSPGASVAQVVEEQAARAAADNAEADSRERLAVSLTGVVDPSGVPLESLSSGLLAQERNARVAADSAEVIARQNLAVTLSQGLNKAAADLQDERVVRANADAAEAASRVALRAELYSRRNMCPDVFEWAQPGALLDGWSVAHVADWGAALFCGDGTKVSGVGAINGPRIYVQPGVTYTISGDTLYRASAGYVCLDMMFYNAQDELVLDGPQQTRGPDHDFTADGSGRRLTEVAATAPATAAYVIPRFWWGDTANVDVIGFRQVKVERGGLPSTPYSIEAEAQTLNANIVEESWVRAQNDAAEAYARQQLEAAYNANNVELYGRIATEEQVRADADSVASQRMDTLSATIVTRPNLCPDVDKWTLQAPCYIEHDSWGKSIRAINPINGTYVCYSPEMPCYEGQTYTVTGDSLLFATSGEVYLDLMFRDAAGNVVLHGPQRPLWTYHDHSTTNVNRDAHAVAVVAPAGAVKFIARFVAENVASCQSFGIRQVKVEQGGLPATVYTQEGEVGAVSAALQVESQVRADQTGTLFGRYSVKIDLNGYMTGYGLLSESNNGENTSTFAVRADRFVVGSASDNAITPFYIEGGTTFMNMVVVKEGSIKNVMIQDATIESAKIVSLSAAKITAGALQVGSYISSANYRAGFDGWAINADGQAEFCQVTVRGTIVSTSGTIGGIVISANEIRSANYNGTGAGFSIRSNGTLDLPAGSVTARALSVTALSAVSANLGDVTAGVVRSPDYGTYINLSAQGSDIAFQVAGGKFYVRANGYAEADRVNIRRRDVMATGSVYWGREWTKNEETAMWNFDLQTGLLIIDTGIDVTEGVDFAINQPFHAIVSCTSANVGFRNLGGNRAFELLTSAQTALSASHYASSGSTPGQVPRIKLMVRVPIVDVHSSVYRIRLDNFNWSLFRI